MPRYKSNQLFNLRLEPDDYGKVLKSGLPVTVPIKLSPGSYAVRVGLWI